VQSLENDMTFGRALEVMLRRTGHALVSEFVTTDRRMAVRLRELRTSKVIAMYHSDAIELARGGTTVAAIVHRNRLVFGSSPGARESLAVRAETLNGAPAPARPELIAPERSHR
jgi:hypothetical protein